MSFLDKLWYQPRYRWLTLPLVPLSHVFERVAARRRLRLQASAVKNAVPVVVIGNLTVGGTGKTPVVIALVRFLMSQGLRVGVISRGYKSRVRSGDAPIILHDEVDPLDVGDEPYLIYRETLCPLAVHPNRTQALALLLEKFKLDVVLSDDGLQHYALARTLEVAVVDAKRQLGNRLCLPAGPLREPPERLHEMDFILVNQGDKAMAIQHSFGAKAFDFYVTPEYLVKADGSRAIMPLVFLQGLTCYAVAGIGHPARFFATLKLLGADIQPRAFPDHHQFTLKDLKSFDNLPIVMTQKDAVKCEHMGLQNIYALEVNAELPLDFLRAFMRKLGYT